MSEQAPSESNFDDTFDEMMSVFEEDTDFTKRLEDINEAVDERVLIDMLFKHGLIDEERGAYYLGPIDDELQQVVKGFYEYCEQIGVDVSSDTASDEQYEQLAEQLVLETYSIRKTVSPGDTVSASNAIIVDVEDDNAMIGVTEGTRVQGEFVDTIMEFLPDDASILTYSSDKQLYDGTNNELSRPLGIGMILTDVVFVDEIGTTERLGSKNAVVIVALGTLGLHVDKHYYRSEITVSDSSDGNMFDDQ